jgi:hypothetical protein
MADQFVIRIGLAVSSERAAVNSSHQLTNSPGRRRRARAFQGVLAYV